MSPLGLSSPNIRQKYLFYTSCCYFSFLQPIAEGNCVKYDVITHVKFWLTMKPTLYWLIALLELDLMHVIYVISRVFFSKFRLKEYQSKLILFPVNSKKPRKGEATEEDIKKASQLAGSVIPIKPVVKRQRAMELTDDLKNFKVMTRHNFTRFFERVR